MTIIVREQAATKMTLGNRIITDLQTRLERNVSPQTSSIQNLRVRIRILNRTKVERMANATRVTATARFVVFDGWTQTTMFLEE
jgi:hypothetical protein